MGIILIYDKSVSFSFIWTLTELPVGLMVYRENDSSS
jgi:hypothetical protein